MSKRNQRSKNKSDNCNINFVFKPDESLTRNLSFSGSAPSSPAASSTGFNLPGNSFGSNSSQPFTFGSPSSQPASNTAFNFATSPSPLKRGASELPASSTPDHNSLRRTASEFSFGTSSNTFTAPTNNTAFAFGSTNPINTDANKAAATGSSAAPTANSAAAPSATGFTFNTATTSESATQPATPAPAFTFGSTNVGFGSSSTASATFGTVSTAKSTPSAPAITSSPAFAFGTSTETTKPASSSAFTFGKPAESAPTTATPAFSFGKPTEATSTSAAATTSTATTATAPTFSFGKIAGTQASSTAEPGKSTTTSSSPFTFGASSTATSTAPATGFTFGSSNTTAATTTTSTTSAAAAAPTFSFGTSTKPPSTTTSTSAAATSVPTFTFGAPGTDSKKDDKKSTPVVTSSPFTFGSTASTSGATSSSSTTTITTTTPLTGPTASAPVENKPNPFSFAKVLEDLSKVPTQPPSQIYASLITPSLAGLYQNQTVQHTSFRIDNISSSTRFTELPEQAQKELDELEKYIRTEGQRCEYIKSHRMPQLIQKMENCKGDTESLSQKLDALSSMLKSRLESTQSLYDTVREQLRHANDGCAVIEASKHPGTPRRWLFGHSDEDDYFSLIAKQLSHRVEEYKRTVWEIERTAESWTKNKAQSPQDIARIMHDQNQTFLALANRVASLHECVEREKEFYKQYFKAYS
ncbi:hypothetical protein G6F46_006401 [Rhizopus delemar]|uniref:Uncharacterized protein n=2 Tax=Rhizopus TaxID=4842 RepID=A0A9P6Z3N2_9FUNG|nr:hypothetical protein G6F55_005653 [Rhizopus delemar]KAG1543320.1 hypothetical protein G6F51_006750 [Rhizopus arrhizus]KAG1496680.1 hypothetical protein G6F54_006307 [Rhizopus delemar]KAG1510447.1 hypothetical protein G6F53_006682 [Rhizopus delemar]KAG1525848.1 hypothetical protein G6F52_002956 [Rhizopus delemar]